MHGDRKEIWEVAPLIDGRKSALARRSLPTDSGARLEVELVLCRE